MDRNEQVNAASQAEGRRLAHMYDGKSDYGSVDQKVHDALLADAIKAHHSELNMDVIHQALKTETKNMKDSNLHINDAGYKSLRRDWTLPVVGIEVGGKVLYDVVEAGEAIKADDARREQEKAQAKASENQGQVNWNPFDGSFGIATALGFKKDQK